MYNLKKKLYLKIFLYCLVKKKTLKKRLVGEERKKKKKVCLIFYFWMIDGRNIKHIPNFSLPLVEYSINYRPLQIFIFERDDQFWKYRLKLKPFANIGGPSKAFKNRVILLFRHRNLLFPLPLPHCFQDETVTLMYLSIIWFRIYLSNENV